MDLFEKIQYDVRPTQLLPVIYKTSKETTEAESMGFGLFPAWSKAPVINARMENLESSRLWKSHIFKNRCIVIASYFYELQYEGIPKPIPWLIRKKRRVYNVCRSFMLMKKIKKQTLQLKALQLLLRMPIYK